MAIADIKVELGRDPHLAKCPLALKSGADATLACAECGRALWMHATRHDTCASFCWVTEDTLTNTQLIELRLMPEADQDLRLLCARALNEFGAFRAGEVRDARRRCASAINHAKEVARKAV